MDTAATLITVAYIFKQGNKKKQLRKKPRYKKWIPSSFVLYRGIFQIRYYIYLFIYMAFKPWLRYPDVTIKFYIIGEINKVSLLNNEIFEQFEIQLTS